MNNPEHQKALHSWRFHGRGDEYFGIWLSNLVLSIATFGIFSAWAKVRRNRYFMGNTEIAGSVLHYHATGLQILRGRLIAFVIVLVYSSIIELAPQLTPFFVVLLLLVFPWLLDRGMAFRCRMVSWRNVHFRWLGSYGIVFRGLLPLMIVFLPLPLLLAGISLETGLDRGDPFEVNFRAMVWMGLASLLMLALYPWGLRAMSRMIIGHIAWGSLRLEASVSLAQYVKRIVLYLYLGLLGGYLLLMGVLVASLNLLGRWEDGSYELSGIFLVFFLAALAILLPLYRASGAMIRDLIVNTTQARDEKNGKEEVYFHAGYRWRKILWIELSNLLMSFVSLGLLIPWAQVRRERYLIEKTALTFNTPLEDMVDRQQERVAALASEYADIEGFDFDPW